MKNDIYHKLVDLYGGRELPEELEAELQAAAAQDDEMRRDMESLRNTVDMLHASPAPDFREESFQRILMKLYARGAASQTQSPSPAHLQYHLPISG